MPPSLIAAGRIEIKATEKPSPNPSFSDIVVCFPWPETLSDIVSN